MGLMPSYHLTFKPGAPGDIGYVYRVESPQQWAGERLADRPPERLRSVIGTTGAGAGGETARASGGTQQR
jgi:hypothetical protein